MFCIAKKELLELRRDPRLFGVVILAPIIQLNVPRLRGDHRRVRTSRSRSSTPIDRRPAGELVHRFEASANFQIRGDAGIEPDEIRFVSRLAARPG